MLEILLTLLAGWKHVFAQQRTTRRAIGQAVATACVVGRRTIARSILVRDTPSPAERGDWSADYKLHARSPWSEQDLFDPILRAALARCPGPLLALATDDTRVPKTGTKIATARWGRDPMSPPFHVNLLRGLRFLHTALIVPLHATDSVTPRALPVWFQEVPPIKKPGAKATEAERVAYREAIKQTNLSTAAVAMFEALRRKVDEAGGADKTLVFALDGNFTNRTIYRTRFDRVVLVGRTRKDARLCWPGVGRRTYAAETFTPESVMKDAKVAWHEVELFYGGRMRTVSYKQLRGVLWRRGAGAKPLQLVVVKPMPYRRRKRESLQYGEPAFLLVSETEGAVEAYLQAYLDRVQIEVAHRELKQEFGVGQAQVRSPRSVARQPALTVATYSAMILAAITAYGARRHESYGPVPRWQREKARASIQDILRKLRHEAVDSPDQLAPFDLCISRASILAAVST